MEKEIKKILNDLEIPKSYTGYYLWTDLILIAAKNYSLKQMPKMKICDAYKRLAKENRMTYHRVERDLRYCIENKKDKIIGYFNYFDTKITNKMFLILVVERLNEKMEGSGGKWWTK